MTSKKLDITNWWVLRSLKNWKKLDREWFTHLHNFEGEQWENLQIFSSQPCQCAAFTQSFLHFRLMFSNIFFSLLNHSKFLFQRPELIFSLFYNFLMEFHGIRITFTNCAWSWSIIWGEEKNKCMPSGTSRNRDTLGIFYWCVPNLHKKLKLYI